MLMINNNKILVNEILVGEGEEDVDFGSSVDLDAGVEVDTAVEEPPPQVETSDDDNKLEDILDDNLNALNKVVNQTISDEEFDKVIEDNKRKLSSFDEEEEEDDEEDEAIESDFTEGEVTEEVEESASDDGREHQLEAVRSLRAANETLKAEIEDKDKKILELESKVEEKQEHDAEVFNIDDYVNQHPDVVSAREDLQKEYRSFLKVYPYFTEQKVVELTDRIASLDQGSDTYSRDVDEIIDSIEDVNHRLVGRGDSILRNLMGISDRVSTVKSVLVSAKENANETEFRVKTDNHQKLIDRYNSLESQLESPPSDDRLNFMFDARNVIRGLGDDAESVYKDSLSAIRQLMIPPSPLNRDKFDSAQSYNEASKRAKMLADQRNERILELAVNGLYLSKYVPGLVNMVGKYKKNVTTKVDANPESAGGKGGVKEPSKKSATLEEMASSSDITDFVLNG